MGRNAQGTVWSTAFVLVVGIAAAPGCSGSADAPDGGDAGSVADTRQAADAADEAAGGAPRASGADSGSAGTEGGGAARLAAERDVADLVHGMTRAIDTWDGPAYVAPLADDPRFIFLGSDSTEISLGYDAIAPEILEGFARAREGGRTGAYRQGRVRTGATSAGDAGWWLQEMTYVYRQDGVQLAYPFRISGFAVHGVEGWQVWLAHASLPAPVDALRRFSRPAGTAAPDGRASSGAAGAVTPPTASVQDAAARAIRALARDLAAALARGDAAAARELFADGPSVLVVDVAPEDVRWGPADVAAHLERLSGASDSRAGAPPGTPLPDSVLARVANGGTHGWWLERGRLRRVEGGRAADLPYRVTGAAVLRDGRWRAVLWHRDVAVPNDSVTVLSEPARE